MKKCKKGNKIPYNGYLLNISEYEKYIMLMKWIEEYKDIIQNIHI